MKKFRLAPVSVSCYSSVTACGVGKQPLLNMLQSNNSALKSPSLFSLPFPTYVGEIVDELPEISRRMDKFVTRNNRVALAVLNEPNEEIRMCIDSAKQRYSAARIGVVIGTSTSGLYETEAAYRYFLKNGEMPADFNFLTRHAYQATARFIQLELGLKGPCYAISTACSSSAKAIAAGQRLINSGLCDAVLVGGVDTLCHLTLRGFHSLELISSQPCRPMDKNRCGISIGEGAALLVLEKPVSVSTDSLNFLAAGETSDAYHMSSPHPEGFGAKLAMGEALKKAGLEASDIDYINLHATATPLNDKIEAKAISMVFLGKTPCSGTKGVTGHTLGAAGAIEASIALLALEHQFIPGNVGFEQSESDLGCHIVRDSEKDIQLQRVMSNSFGFGGNNTSLIFSRGLN